MTARMSEPPRWTGAVFSFSYFVDSSSSVSISSYSWFVVSLWVIVGCARGQVGDRRFFVFLGFVRGVGERSWGVRGYTGHLRCNVSHP